MRGVLRPLVVGILLLAPAGAGAQTAELMARACMSCHGIDGKSPGAIPSLAGTDAKTLAEAMKGFAAGSRKGTVMNLLAKGYSEPQIEALAAFFGSRR